ncbi:MAG TPA: fused MFS/spermidine synthase, partial [Nitrospiria bacterium]
SGLAVLIVFSFPHWDPRVMTSGIRIYAPSYAKTFSTLGNVLQDEEILFKKDGISSTVSIHKRAGITFLRVNGKTDASNGSDMGTQLLVGHLPSLLHPNPRSAFIVGLGSGVTPGAIARYPLERIDVVEIEPAMVEASSFFVAENRGVLSDPRVKLHHGDAKNVLLRSDEKYDLIINEPSNPWINGIATLFTEEFFALTRSRLNPEGVMVQWLQGYALSREDMRTVIATFLKVYPHASLWQASNVDYILVGGDGPRPLDLQRVRHVFHTNAGVREDLKRLGNEFPEVIAGDFFLNREELEKFSRGAVLNTDDLLPLGFSAPKSLYLNTVRSNRAALREVKESTHPLIKNEEPDFLQDPEYHFQLANKFFKKRIINEGVASLGQALMLDPDHDEARMLRGKTFFVNQRFAEAINDFKEVSGKNPGLPEPVFALGMAYSRVKDWERASRYMARAASLDPQNSEYRIELARVYARMGKDSQALKEYQLVMGGENGVSRIGGEVAATLVRLKQPGEALAVLKESIEVSSEDFRLHFQMGEVFLSMEKPVEAREAFNRVIEINPESVKAYVGLGRAWAALGDEVKANEFIKKAKHLDSAVQIPSDLTAINNQV